MFFVLPHVLSWVSAHHHHHRQLQSIDCGPVEAWSVGFSPEGNHIASGNYAGKINIYATEGGHHVTTLDTRGRFTYSIAYVSHLQSLWSSLNYYCA